jgi:hypothetical protein
MAKPTIEAVSEETLPEFAAFLHAHMQYPRSTEGWIAGLRTSWGNKRPNYGFVLRDEGQIVGGIGAIYAERQVRGRPESFCNITSWCVLDSHRKFSMQLAMAVIGQPGYHFTDFSPTKVVGGALKFLNFKPIDEAVAVILNFPALPFPGKVVSKAGEIGLALEGRAKDVWQDHTGFPWLTHVLVGEPGAWCHVIYKRGTFKGLPCARVIYLSDPSVFERRFPRLAWHFLGRGIVSTHVERRWLSHPPGLFAVRTGFNAKLFLSPTLAAPDIDYLYSESVALDL